MSLFVGVLIASCSLPAAGAILSLVKKPNHSLCAAALLLLSGLCLSLAAMCWNASIIWQAPPWLSIGLFPVQMGVDSLSSFFLLLLGVVTGCCAIYSPRYLEHLERKLSGRFYWSALFAFVGGMVGVLAAGNAIVFLVSWEVMSIGSAALVLTDFRQQRAQKATMN